MNRYILESCVMTDVGKVREHNEDNFFFYGQINDDVNAHIESQRTEEWKHPVLFGVFDGMGGESYGEKASFLMADICRQYELHKNYLEEDAKALCHIGNERVTHEADERAARMGSTASMLIFGEDVIACNVGDSPIFLYREGKLCPIYQEHTEKTLYESLNLGHLLEKKKKYRLTQNLGMSGEDMSLQPYTEHIDLQDGDLFLICSDGLTDMVSEETIAEYLGNLSGMRKHTEYQSDEICLGQTDVCADNVSSEKTYAEYQVEKAGKELVDLALEAGGRDNVTLVLIRVSADQDVSKKEIFATDKIKTDAEADEDYVSAGFTKSNMDNPLSDDVISGSIHAEKSADGCHKKKKGQRGLFSGLQEATTLKNRLDGNMETLRKVAMEDGLVKHLRSKREETTEIHHDIRNGKTDGD